MALRIIKLVKLLTSTMYFSGTTAQPPEWKEFTHPSIPELSITRVLFLWERLYMHIYQLNMLIPAAIQPPGTSPGVFMTRNCWYPLIDFSQLRHHLVSCGGESTRRPDPGFQPRSVGPPQAWKRAKFRPRSQQRAESSSHAHPKVGKLIRKQNMET